MHGVFLFAVVAIVSWGLRGLFLGCDSMARRGALCCLNCRLNNASLIAAFDGMLRMLSHPEEGSCKRKFICEQWFVRRRSPWY